mgnify:CR=1 FL=1
MIRTNAKIATGHIFILLATIVHIYIMPALLSEIETVTQYEKEKWINHAQVSLKEIFKVNAIWHKEANYGENKKN